MSTTVDGAYEWHIITSEYPPQVGGVSEYVAALASHLAKDWPTHVWCPSATGSPAPSPGITLHRVLGSFSAADLRHAGERLDQQPSPRRLLVQWVPHGFGYRSLNLAMAIWLLGRARTHHDELQVMVHEPCSPLSLHPARLVAALMHRLMLTVVCAGASKVWTSTPSWHRVIRPFLLGRLDPEWLPIPGPDVGLATRAATRSLSAEIPVVGHFGTYSPLIAPLLDAAIDVVFERSRARVVLIGRDSERFGAEYVGRHPQHAERLQATGLLPLERVGQHLATCDVMLQPYPDGVSARRTSVLALLHAGLPVVTNGGHLCESFWADEQAVELVEEPDGAQIGLAAVRLLGDAERRERLSVRARTMYARYFDVSHCVEALTHGVRHVPWQQVPA